MTTDYVDPVDVRKWSRVRRRAVLKVVGYAPKNVTVTISRKRAATVSRELDLVKA